METLNVEPEMIVPARFVESYMKLVDDVRNLHNVHTKFLQITTNIEAHREANRKLRDEVARLTEENRRLAQRMEEMATGRKDQLGCDPMKVPTGVVVFETPATPTFEELFKLRAFRRDVLDMAFASGVAFCGKGLKLELNAVSLAIRCNPAGNDEFQRRCDEIDRMRKFKGINGDLKGIVYDERDVDIYNYVSSEDVWL